MKDVTRGWTDEEDAALMKAAFAAREKHLPLTIAFDEIASALHRRPNSVDITDVAEQKRELIKLYACQYFGGELERVEVGLTRANGLRSALLSGDAEGAVRAGLCSAGSVSARSEHAACRTPAEGRARARTQHPRAARHALPQSHCLNAGRNGGINGRLSERRFAPPFFVVVSYLRIIAFLVGIRYNSV